MATISTQILEAGHKRWTRTGSVVSELIVVVLVIVAIVGAVVGKLLVTALCGLVLVVTIVSRIWARLALVDVDYHCLTSSDRLVEGDIIDLTQTVENRKPLPVTRGGKLGYSGGGGVVERTYRGCRAGRMSSTLAGR